MSRRMITETSRNSTTPLEYTITYGTSKTMIGKTDLTESITSSSTDYNVSVTYYNLNRIECEKCDGTGFQQRDDGIFVICPICNGTGWREQKRECEPTYPCPLPAPWYPPDHWTEQMPTYLKYRIIC